ncbi:MAG: lipase maturation factor family protein [Ignavibacteriales bacterium]
MILWRDNYWLTRLVLQRSLAFVYLIAFIVVIHQFKPLLGERGLLPVPQFIKQVRFTESPSIFFWFPTNFAFDLFGWIGVALSLFAISGFSEKFGNLVSAATWGALWLIYLSFVNVGQTFYAFGWETLLLEAGFLAIFLGSEKTTPSFLLILLFNWLLFRVMFGAGLIKIRGDTCWRDLTCLQYHYETQPMPNPFSWYFHWLPVWIHKTEVLFNHFTELVVPFAYFAPSPISAVAGLITLFFHSWLFASGNFSFLGFLTMVVALSTISDSWLKHVIPIHPPELAPPSPLYLSAILGLTVLVAALSFYPIRNMISQNQLMNASFEPLHLVNTYGAFGTITRPRYEVIVEGTNESVLTWATRWREYEFIGKPGDVSHTPPQIAPYHLRLDWLMWFAAFSSPGQHPWFISFLEKLLEGDKAVLGLLRYNPFPNEPPKFVRALLYEYHFTTPEERSQTGAIWNRKLIGLYFPPVSLRKQ